LIAIVVGGRLYRNVGMLAGVPVVALIYSIVRENVDKKWLMNQKEDTLKLQGVNSTFIEQIQARHIFISHKGYSSYIISIYKKRPLPME
jgi:hypothetical protein